MKSIIITIEVEKDEDAKELLEAISKKKNITWHNDTKIADLKIDVPNKKITIKQSRINHPEPLRL